MVYVWCLFWSALSSAVARRRSSAFSTRSASPASRAAAAEVPGSERSSRRGEDSRDEVRLDDAREESGELPDALDERSEGRRTVA